MVLVLGESSVCFFLWTFLDWKYSVSGLHVVCLFVCWFFFLILQLYCPTGISPMVNSCFFPWGKTAVTVTLPQPTVHAGCFSVSIIHQTLTWTTWSLTCAQMLIHAVAHSLHWKLTWRQFRCCTGETDLAQWRACLTFYQLSYIPTPQISLLWGGNQLPFFFFFLLLEAACLLQYSVLVKKKKSWTVPIESRIETK